MLLDLKFWWDGSGGAAAPVGPPLAHDTAIWLGGYDLTGAIAQVALVASRAEIQNTRMSDDIDASHPGDESVSATVSGIYSAGAGEPDGVVAPRLFGGSYDEWPLTILPPLAPGAAGDDGNVAYNVRSVQHGIQFGGEEGQLLPYYIASRARKGKLDRGTVMIPKATRTASFDGTARLLGPVAGGAVMVAILHVFSVTGASGSVRVTVENGNAGFASSLVIGTFDAVTTAAGVGRQVLALTLPAPYDYWRFRVAFTPGTNYSLAAVAALEPA